GEVLVDARTKPLAYGHGGNGSAMHLSGELLKMMTNVPLLPVAYKGSGPVATDVLGGQVPLGVVDVPSAIANMKAGKLRALAVTTRQRISAAPDVPTFEEAGIVGYESIGWFGAVAPAGTPAPVIERLNTEIRAALSVPDVREKALAAGCEPAASSPQEFAAFIRDEARKWGDVIRKAGVKIE
ncbi:MAG TPA: tripartite tricarboxylate transporter substrate-binding protein, partial [Burkholderiales bacterium]|nr:tripartite tricarboxylate transporter substrate-binding protein [Burkholderiales bacterium]